MTWAQVLETFSKIAPGTAALMAAFAARSGLKTWRRQLKGNAEFEVARRVLRAALTLRGQFDLARSPVISPGERDAARTDAGILEGAPDSTPSDSVYVYDRRLRQLRAAFFALQGELLEAEVLWGSTVLAPLDELAKCMGEFHSAVAVYLEVGTARGPVPEAERQLHLDTKAVLYAGWVPSAADPFGTRLREAIGAVENRIRPHLRLDLE